jgi:hypothetical protein
MCLHKIETDDGMPIESNPRDANSDRLIRSHSGSHIKEHQYSDDNCFQTAFVKYRLVNPLQPATTSNAIVSVLETMEEQSIASRHSKRRLRQPARIYNSAQMILNQADYSWQNCVCTKPKQPST